MWILLFPWIFPVLFFRIILQSCVFDSRLDLIQGGKVFHSPSLIIVNLHGTKYSPGIVDHATGSTLLMFFLVGLVGLVAGAVGTILTISTQRLERLQSRLCWVNSPLLFFV